MTTVPFSCPYAACCWPKCEDYPLCVDYPACQSAIEAAKRSVRIEAVPLGRTLYDKLSRKPELKV